MEQKNNPAKFPVLFFLYIAQSVPMSFFSTVVPVIMRQEQYSLQSIGLLQLIKLPWILKFLWAPLVDNYACSGRQIRRWIIFSELFYAFVILSVGFFSLQTDFVLIICLVIIAFIASATQDIATDIYAIQLLSPTERGIGNSFQSAGSFVGSLLGTGVLLLAYHYFGWHNMTLLLASFVVFAIVPLLLHKPRLSITKKKERFTLSGIGTFFGTSERRKRLPVLLFYYSGIIGILAMIKPFMVDHGYNVKQIGFMSGIMGTSVAVLSSFLAAGIMKLTGRKGALYLFAFINLLAAIFFFSISKGIPSLAELYVAICMVWGAYGLSSVAIYTTSMDIVRKGHEGTDFTLQIVITQLSGLFIAVMSGRVGDILGYSGIFGIEIILAIISILFLLYTVPLKAGKK